MQANCDIIRHLVQDCFLIESIKNRYTVSFYAYGVYYKKELIMRDNKAIQRGVIYARYSPGPKQRDESIEGQLRECKEYAEKEGIQIIGSYIDKKISGRSDN